MAQFRPTLPVIPHTTLLFQQNLVVSLLQLLLHTCFLTLCKQYPCCYYYPWRTCFIVPFIVLCINWFFICKRYVRPWSGEITVLMTASLIQERATGKNKSYDNDIHPGLALVFYQRRWSAKSDKTHEQNMYTCSCFVYRNFLVSPTRDTC